MRFEIKAQCDERVIVRPLKTAPEFVCLIVIENGKRMGNAVLSAAAARELAAALVAAAGELEGRG